MGGERLRKWAGLSHMEWRTLRKILGIVLVAVLTVFLFRPRFIIEGGLRSDHMPLETGKTRFSVQANLTLTIEFFTRTGEIKTADAVPAREVETILTD